VAVRGHRGGSSQLGELVALSWRRECHDIGPTCLIGVLDGAKPVRGHARCAFRTTAPTAP
jgi:hypothetical protein